MALSDAVAAQIMGELHTLTREIENQRKRTEDLATTVIAAANAVDAKKTILHHQNEKFLVDRVNEITEAIREFKGIEGAVQKAAVAQADKAVDDGLGALKAATEHQRDRILEAAKLFRAANETHAQIAKNIKIAMLIFAVAVSGAFYAGIRVGAANAAKTDSAAPVVQKSK